MQRLHSSLARGSVKLAALAIIAVSFTFARLPRLADSERAALAGGFRFTRFDLPAPAGPERRTVRRVHPSLERIASWISSVGASIALADLDGDGLANDVCYVDTGGDQVVVTPVPDTGERYPTFALEPGPELFDRATMAPMGCLPGDLNEDGREDLLVYYWGRTPLAFLRRGDLAGNGPLGAGLYRAQAVGPAGERWYTNAATRADVDGDGHVDLVLGNYFADGARILDADADGREQMQHSMSRAANAGRNRILLWAGATAGAVPGVELREAVGALPGRAEVGWTLAVGAADLDGDLLPELYFGNDFGPDVLLHNRSHPGEVRLAPLQGRRTLTTPRSKVLGGDSFKGMGVDFADLNGDGMLDIFVSNIADEYALEESHFLWLSSGEAERMRDGVAPYTDRSEALGLSRSGWAWDTRLADLDNDGTVEALQATGFVAGKTSRWPELHELAMGNDLLLQNPRMWPTLGPGDGLSGHAHNPFFVRSASGRYFDLAPWVGLGDAMVTRGIATADVDGDGDLDLAFGNQWQPSCFFRNDRRGSESSLTLDLRLPAAPGATPAGRVAGSPAIGATAEVTLADGRRLIGQVDGGNGHSGARSPELVFGLGRSPGLSRFPVRIAWRGRDGAVHRDALVLPPGRHTLLLEERGTLVAAAALR